MDDDNYDTSIDDLSEVIGSPKSRLDEQEGITLEKKKEKLKKLKKETEQKDQEIQAAKSHAEIKDYFAKRLMRATLAQLVVLNLVFIAYGLGFLEFNDYVLHVYIVGTLAELIGVILVISRGLFDSDKKEKEKKKG